MKDEDQEVAYSKMTEEEIAEINMMAVKFQRRVVERFVDLSEAIQDLDDGPKKQRLIDILRYMAGKPAQKS
jgi:hypothetical protein